MSSKKWLSKRKKAILLKWSNCQRCWSKEKICVHHWSYESIWNEDMNHLFVLCECCHNEFHKIYGVTKKMLCNTESFIKKHKKKNIYWKYSILLIDYIWSYELLKIVDFLKTKNEFKINSALKYMNISQWFIFRDLYKDKNKLELIRNRLKELIIEKYTT